MSSRKTIRNRKIPSIYAYDDSVRLDGRLVAGLDEAGRGPLAGPVVAAAVIFPSGVVIEGLRDSKKIPEKDRKKVFWNVVRCAAAVGVGIVGADTIDRINILQSTKRAMITAVAELPVKPDVLLIDAVKLDGLDIEQHSMIKGESVSASIAAASVVAKVVRDDIMLDYHEMYPAYNFRGHKGYSTREHVKHIKSYGPCPIHRRSFRKVKDDQLPLGFE